MSTAMISTEVHDNGFATVVVFKAYSLTVVETSPFIPLL